MQIQFLHGNERSLLIGRYLDIVRTWLRVPLLPRGLALVLIVSLSACSSGGGSGDAGVGPADTDPEAETETETEECSLAEQNQWVYDSMLDYYLFYDQVPVLDPLSYESPRQLLSNIRFEERDSFSHIRDAVAANLQSVSGKEFGLGYIWRFDSDNNARVLDVVADSPIGRAGVVRGDILVSVNGMAWTSQELADVFQSQIVGSAESPASSSWVIQKGSSGEMQQIEITTALYDINTVGKVATYENEVYSGKVGYMVFNRFLETSEQELIDTFTYFDEEGITDLIVDLRYNSGGRVYIATFLSSLIAGDSRAGSILYDYIYNDKYQANNFSISLEEVGGDLNLSRVVFLTGNSTASASEIVSNGLAPHMEVITVGSRTAGKPYVQRGRDRCGLKLNAIEGEGFNASGVSVFGGTPPTCHASDDFRHDYGHNGEGVEGQLLAGLDFLVHGTCNTAASASLRSKSVTGIDALDESTRQGYTFEGGAVW